MACTFGITIAMFTTPDSFELDSADIASPATLKPFANRPQGIKGCPGIQVATLLNGEDASEGNHLQPDRVQLTQDSWR